MKFNISKYNCASRKNYSTFRTECHNLNIVPVTQIFSYLFKKFPYFFAFHTFCIIRVFPAARNWNLTWSRVIPFQVSRCSFSTHVYIISLYVSSCRRFSILSKHPMNFQLPLILFDTTNDVISSVLLLLNPTYTKILSPVSQPHTHALKPSSHTHTLFSELPLSNLFSNASKHPFLTRVSNISQTTKFFNKHLRSDYVFFSYYLFRNIILQHVSIPTVSSPWNTHVK
jgi:hypothetical protein